MANSTGSELLALLENHLNLDTTSASTDPTQALLISYINQAQREIAYEIQPSVLMSEATNIATTAGSNTVTKPSTFIEIQDLYSNDSGVYKRLEKKALNKIVSPVALFDNTSGNTPSYYEERNDKIVFDTNFVNTDTDALKAYGLLAPTDLDADDLSPAVDLPKEYNMLIVYKSAIWFYQRDFDSKNLQINVQFESMEKQKLRAFFKPCPASVSLDPRFWNHNRI